MSSVLWCVSVAGEDRRAGSADWWCDNHQREPADEVTVQVVDHGGMTYCTKGERHTVEVGQAVLFRFGEDSAYGFPPGGGSAHVSRWLGLRGAGLAEHWDLLRAEGGPVLRWTRDLDGQMRRLARCADPAARTEPLALAAQIHAFVLALAAVQRRQAEAAASPLDRACAELMRQPCAPWSLKELASRHGLSREHLGRAFVARFGQSPGAFLIRSRAERAVLLLRRGSLSVAEVARLSGFGSTHACARAVKALTGNAPSALSGITICTPEVKK